VSTENIVLSFRSIQTSKKNSVSNSGSNKSTSKRTDCKDEVLSEEDYQININEINNSLSSFINRRGLIRRKSDLTIH
jgi:hypothetical protein